MATPLNIVAQYAQDAFLQNYRVSTDFATIEDWIFHCSAGAAKFYQTLYEKEYARMRADGQADEVVAFSNDFLSDQFIKVEEKDGEIFARLTQQVFSFAYDQSNVGIQNVFCNVPRPAFELERGDIDEFWQYEYLPNSKKTFWALDGSIIRLKKQGLCNVKELRVIYVPEISINNPEAQLPDGIVSDVIDLAVTSMKNYNQNVIQKQVIDENGNKSFSTEGNLGQARETLRETFTR